MEKLSLEKATILALEGKLNINESKNNITAREIAGQWHLSKCYKRYSNEYHEYRGFKKDLLTKMRMNNITTQEVNNEISKWSSYDSEDLSPEIIKDINSQLKSYYSNTTHSNGKLWPEYIVGYIEDRISKTKDYFSIPKMIRAYSNPYVNEILDNDIEDRLTELDIDDSKLTRYFKQYLQKISSDENYRKLTDDELKFICNPKFTRWQAISLTNGLLKGLSLEQIKDLASQKLTDEEIDEQVEKLLNKK